jgi:N-acetylneuraminate synthase
MEFSEEEWRTLKQHAEKLGLVFISSPFSIEAVDLLSRLDVKVWKIGSGEITNLPMLQQIGNTGLPVILSTGMSTWPEIDDAVNLISQYRNPIALLQCTTDYPCPPEKAGLNNIYELRKRYSVPVGFSSHSHETTQCLMAASIGINILEFHITLSKYSYGPDVKASLDPGQTRYMVSQIRDIEIMRKSKTDKEILAADLDSIRKCFYKSIVAKKDIKTGTILNTDLLTAKKPGTGIPPKEINSLVGKRVKKNLAKDEILTYEDLED